MEYLNLDKYKNWEIDTYYYNPFSEKGKFLKKGDERVKILYHKDTIQLEESSIIHPYTYIYVYDKETKRLITYVKEIYMTEIICHLYNSIGKLTKEINHDKDYKFSVKDLIEKIRKEYQINLEDRRDGGILNKQLNEKKIYYEVRIKTENPLKLKYILIDGQTGATLYEDYDYTKGNNLPPFMKYLKSLENKQKQSSTPYRTHNGKNFDDDFFIFDEELYKNRFKIERSFAWLDGFKGLIMRYETLNPKPNLERNAVFRVDNKFYEKSLNRFT